MTAPALQQWEITRRLKPSIPTLHRNLGYAVLRSSESPDRAIELFREGMKYDLDNIDLYLGLEEAMEKAGQSPGERARVLQSFPKLQSAPAALVFRLAQLLGEAGEFDQAERQLANRFFPREEGGANVRQIYIALKLSRAKSLATQGKCDAARETAHHAGDPVQSLSFTAKGLDPFLTSDASKQTVSEIQTLCR